MCPESWQDQNDLTQDLLPQSVRKLLGILENVKKVVASYNAKEKVTKESTEKDTGKVLRKSPEKVNERVLIPKNFSFPKRQKLRKAACCARNLGACTRPIYR